MWDDVNECTYWEREAGIGCKENQQYCYEDPFFGLKQIDIFEEYHEVWYIYNSKTEQSTLMDEIDKKKKGNTHVVFVVECASSVFLCLTISYFKS